MRDRHQHLLNIVKRFPEDYEPFGAVTWDDRMANNWMADCSGGCRFAHELQGDIGFDWVVCTNPASHRCGLLTFEHQGCRHFEPTHRELPPLGNPVVSDLGVSQGGGE